jgi:putative addiction module CopG family antidote
MDDVTLPPELERFTAEAIATGRYRDLSEVVAAGVSLLRRQERARTDFIASHGVVRRSHDRSR